MLRMLFGESPRQEEGPLAATNQSIRHYLQMLNSIPFEERNSQERRYIIWSSGFMRALDELEQSNYAAVRFSATISHAYIEDMSEEELLDYHRHLYFYRNAIIRIFAILDKLGHFMNERFRLKTEEIKSRFSYFTVLRNMHQHHLYTELEQQLFDLKVRFKDPVERLRNERNLEIHTINADLLDDLLKVVEEKQLNNRGMKAENVQGHLKDLTLACQMVYAAVGAAFDYISSLSESTGRYETDRAES
jgi:hypothetical protein